MAWVMIAQWENECISLPVLSVAQVRFPVVAEYCKGFSLVNHTRPAHPEQAWQKMAQSSFNDTCEL